MIKKNQHRIENDNQNKHKTENKYQDKYKMKIRIIMKIIHNMNMKK